MFFIVNGNNFRIMGYLHEKKYTLFAKIVFRRSKK